MQRQIVMQIAKLIEGGMLAPEARLPSVRSLSSVHGIARNTVILAYHRLESEGWINIRQGASITVAAQPPVRHPRSLLQNSHSDIRAACNTFLPELARVFSPPRVDGPVRYRVDFRLGETAPELFPRDAWQHWASVLIRHTAASASSYLDPQGLPELRSAIAEHVGATRGIATNGGDIVIVHGIQEALSIVASLLLDKRSRVLVESPCYKGAHNVFAAFGAHIDYLPVDEYGANFVGVTPDDISLLHITPSHQFPLGVTLSADRRIEILEWAKAANTYIFENDYDADFRYEGPPLAAIASIDRERVIYVGTFSKNFGPGLRLGYMVCPPGLTPYVRKAKALLNSGCSWLDQAVVSRLITSGDFAAHLRTLRLHYKERRDLLMSVLGKHGGRVRGEGGGSHVCWELPVSWPCAEDVEAKLKTFGIKIYLAKEIAVCGIQSREISRLLFIGFGSISTDCINELSRALDRLSPG
jgi:GntR family transcriptional regulator/MocR family aminotransferase